jgi:LuxR family maltose regulon positive regulatory protein
LKLVTQQEIRSSGGNELVTEQLLQTKLQIPRRRTQTVIRSRLNARLNRGLESRLILISAPAGFGKTTLLTEWVSHTGYPSAWLSLDENDNVPALFIAYFIAALQKVKPGLGESAKGLLNLPRTLLLKSMLVNLINEIHSIPDHFTLVLDDYHKINNHSIHKAISFLIDNLPANLHLVIATRSDPLLNLAHLRGRGQLTELRVDDLRFTLEEITEFLNQVMELNLEEDEIILLKNRSEGWIAGLQMAAITLKERPDATGFIKAFSHSSRDALDYLYEEVFKQQTPEIQSFLLETSILDSLSSSLCDKVTERQDSYQILDKIEKANLFIFSLDNELLWYHYHPLLKNLLQHTLGNTHPEALPLLHRRASEWYERENLFPSAITHALKAKDYDRAARLIERRAGEILSQGELVTYLTWMDSFPESIIQMYPILLLHRILAETLLTGMPLEDIEAQLQKVEKLDPQSNLIRGAGMAVRAVALGNQADLSKNPDLSRKALELIPPESTFWRGLADSGLKQYWLLEGGVASIPNAINIYNEAIETGQKIGNIFFTVLAIRRLAEAYMAAGHIHHAQSYYQKILDVAVDRQGQLIPIASFGFYGLGALLREWNDLEKALNYLEKGITLESGKLGHWQVDGIIELARTRQAMGDLEGACRYLQKARQLLNKFPRYRSHEPIITAYEIGMAITQGDMVKVNAWVEECNPEALIELIDPKEETHRYLRGFPAHELELLTLVRAYLAQNKPAEALKVLDGLFKTANKLGRAGIMLETNVLYAVVYKAIGDAGKALNHIKQALLAAEREGYMRLFLDAGPAITSLLYEAAQQSITPAYIHRLISSLPASESTPRRLDKFIKIEEPLSNRELSVLALIAQGLSNKEIGGRLYIETRTVKWHISNIIGKLGVKNRTQAMVKASALGIITANTDLHSQINS